MVRPSLVVKVSPSTTEVTVTGSPANGAGSVTGLATGEMVGTGV